ncbi:MAG: hypothetical protein ACQPRI_06550 [Solitalea-like symbiont of Tyrophagus putrescentiae]
MFKILFVILCLATLVTSAPTTAAPDHGSFSIDLPLVIVKQVTSASELLMKMETQLKDFFEHPTVEKQDKLLEQFRILFNFFFGVQDFFQHLALEPGTTAEEKKSMLDVISVIEHFLDQQLITVELKVLSVKL